MVIAREGFAPIAVCVVLAALLASFGWWLAAAVAALLLAVCTWCYAEAIAPTVATPLAAVSPVAGRVLRVAHKPDPWLDGRASLRVVLRVPLPGFRTLRAPLEGKVKDFWVRGGVPRDDPTAQGSPTCYTLWIQTDEGDDLVLAVHGRRLLSRFRSRVSPGERIGHGHKLGYVYFCTAVTVYLPDDAEGHVQAGERLTAGGTLLATLQRAL